jgi:hypothetical protein
MKVEEDDAEDETREKREKRCIKIHFSSDFERFIGKMKFLVKKI